MDENNNKPLDGSEQKKPGGGKPYHKYNKNRRKPNYQNQNSGTAEADNSPNGMINVKPGRYDLPPEAADSLKKDAGNINKKPSDEKPPQKKPFNHNNPRKHYKNDRSAADSGSQKSAEIQNPAPAAAVAENLADSPKPSQKPSAPNSGNQQKRPKFQKKRGGYPRRDNRGDAPRADSNKDINRDAGGVQTRGDTLLADETRSSGSHPSGIRGKNISAEVVEQLTAEAAEIDEYIAVSNGTDETASESEITAELNSALTVVEVPGSEPNGQSGDDASGQSPDGESQSADPPSPDDEKPLKTFEIVGVRFKAAGKIYYFDPNGLKFVKNESVIVDTARGLEYGIVDIQNRIVTEREVVLPLRTVIRRATADDIARAEANAARAKEAFDVCVQKITEHKLEMKLVDVEYTFDNSKLLFYFTADGRIDFRELVKDLASVFRTRIELRQIGIRDETKLLGGIGICGRPFCCKTFLSDFVQVSIKMAKEQNLSLNSVKISGACGRLMCCLRYEYDTYQEEIRKTPKVDQLVSTPDGDGTVIEVQPLAGLVRVRFIDKPETLPKVYHRDNVTVIGGKSAPAGKNPPRRPANAKDTFQPKPNPAQSAKPDSQVSAAPISNPDTASSSSGDGAELS